MKKRILVVLAAASLAGGVATSAMADHGTNPTYSNKCRPSDHSNVQKRSSTEVVNTADPELKKKGSLGIRGGNGYLVADGDPSTTKEAGEIHGSTAGSEGYGSLSGKRTGTASGNVTVCAGSGSTEQSVSQNVG